MTFNYSTNVFKSQCNLPIYIPGNTGIDLSPDVIIKMSSHPNVIGVKDSGGDIAKTAFILNKTKAIRGDEFQFLAGSASFLLPTFQVGGVGGEALGKDELTNLGGILLR